MEKWFKTCLIFTVGLLVITGFFIWITKADDVDSLSYVADKEWSKNYRVTPELETNNFVFALDNDRNIHSISPQYIHPKGNVILRYNKSNDKGKLIVEQKELEHTDRIGNSTLISHDDFLHLFWVGKQDNQGWTLLYTKLDLEGNIIFTKKLVNKSLVKVKELQAIPTQDNKFMLIWSDVVDEYRQIKSMIVSSSGKPSSNPTQITSYDGYHITVPKVISDKKGRYHLTWQKGQKYRSSYQLYYQRLDEKGHTITSPINIDRASIDYASMAVKGDRLYLAWTKAMDYVRPPIVLFERNYPNYEICATTIDLDQPEKFEIQRLTHQNGPSYQHVMGIDEKGNINLIYIDLYDMHLAFTNSVFGENFEDIIREPRRIFPNQTMASTPNLVTDNNQKLHIFWQKSKSNLTSLRYANTANPKSVSPLSIIGLNSDDYFISSIMSLAVLLFLPLGASALTLHFISVLVLPAIMKGITTFFYDSKVAKLCKNKYISVGLICGFFLVYQKLIINARVFWPYDLTTGQMWTTFVIATVTLVAFIAVTKPKMEEFQAFEVGLTSFMWFYWMYLIYYLMKLPIINHFYISVFSPTAGGL